MITLNTYYTDEQALKSFVADNHKELFAKDARSILVQVFCGINDREFISSLLEQINTLLPGAQVIGTTTSGEIVNGKVRGLSAVLSFSVFKHTSVRVAFCKQEHLESFDTGRSIAAGLAGKSAKLLVLFSTNISVDASRLLEGVQAVTPRLPVAGGISGNNHDNQQGFVFCKDCVTDCGAVGAVLQSERLIINQYRHLCWFPLGKEMTITKADGSRIYTIDGIPANQIYKKYLGVDSRRDMIIKSIFPLFSVKHGIEMVRTPMHAHDDGSIDFSDKISVGEKVRFSIGHVETILKSTDKLIQNIKMQPVESIFVYSCVLRRGFLQESSEIETLPLQNIAPTAGFFTNGEFFHKNGVNQLLQATMTTVTLSESDKAQDHSVREQQKQVPQKKTEPNAAAKDHVKSSNVLILKALTNIINTTTAELSARTIELEKANRETLYKSTHDPLTGLYNRNFYEQEMWQLQSDSAPLCVIICDVDGLKLINDTLGHGVGDQVLKATAQILKSVFGEDSLIARIGGDEYSILIPDNSSTNIKRAFNKIDEAISEYNAENPSIPLSVSFGYACCDNSFHQTDALFKEADNRMYREKLHRSKSIRSDIVQTLIQTLEARDIMTEDHSGRLQEMIANFADSIGLSMSEISDLRLFARFHDIGKVGIPDHLLLKNGPLTTKERIEMQRHSEIGYRIARSSTDLLPLADLILKHHEWWNGKGYPLGLSGEEIPYECRILAIIDSYDAMTNDRPYRKAMSEEAAFKELRRCAGTQFDPVLVEKFIACNWEKS